MLLSYFPYLTYAVPAVAGLLIMITVIEAGYKWALGALQFYFPLKILCTLGCSICI